MATNTGYIDFNEAAAPATPAAAKSRLYAKADGLLYSKDDAGVETLVSGGAGGGSVATDAIWDAKGDLAGGTGANTAARLAVGANDTVLTAASGEATGLKWAVPKPSASENILTTAVTMTLAATWYDGPSLSLAAGNWLVWGKAIIQVASASATGILSRIYDGTTVWDASEFNVLGNAGQIWTMPVGPVKITLAGTTTVKLQCHDQARTNSVILDTGSTGMPTDKGTILCAMTIA